MASPSSTLAPSGSAHRALRTYDHSAFYPTIRPTDVFLCTYPKSGTTWLGFLIAHVLKQQCDEQIDLKSMGRYVPDVNLLYTKRGSLASFAGMPDPRFFLCHATFDAHLPNVVYVIRDPRDTLVSYWHYQKFLNKEFDRSLEEFIAAGNQWPCEWDEHVASWLLPRRHPRLMVVRYEELHEDAGANLRKVLSFAGVESADTDINAAVVASRFDQMCAKEETFGVHGKAGDQAERFVRKGRVGGWREEMSDEDLRLLEQRYGDVMKHVGYELVG